MDAPFAPFARSARRDDGKRNEDMFEINARVAARAQIAMTKVAAPAMPAR